MPALIFYVGIALLGTYGEGQPAGLGSFFGDFFADLASGEVRTWALALGPLVLVSLVRLIFVGVRHKEPVERSSEPAATSASSREQRRIEPRVNE